VRNVGYRTIQPLVVNLFESLSARPQ